jgi:hypothetical protein
MKLSIIILGCLILSAQAVAFEDEGEAAESNDIDMTMYRPDGTNAQIKSKENEDGTTTTQADYYGQQGHEGYMDTVMSKDGRHAYSVMRSGISNPDFDGEPVAKEFDENDESVTGVAVFHPDGSSLSHTMSKRKDGGMDVRAEVHSAEENGVASTTEKSLKAIQETQGR